MILATSRCPCIRRMLTLTPQRFVALHKWLSRNGEEEAAEALLRALPERRVRR